jgi:predicted transcriptional regulator
MTLDDREGARPEIQVRAASLTLKKIVEILEAEVLGGEAHLEKKVERVGASDLMSDVLAFMTPGALLLTGLKNPQVIRTAEMADLSVVCFVRGKTPEAQAIELANAREIPLLRTRLPMYEACGKLYQAGLKACF